MPLTGDLLTAQEAHELDGIGHVLSASELDTKLARVVGKPNHGVAKAIRWTKTGYTLPLRQLAHGHRDTGTAYARLTN